MITNFNNDRKKDDRKILALLCLIIIIVVWFVAPPRNKMAQICFWGKNTQYWFAQRFDSNVANEWVFHRNNAIYLARMDNPKGAMKEMHKAFVTMPSYVSDEKLSKLYKDSATLKIYYKDYKGALDDYTRVKTKLDLTDRLKLALLYKMNGNNKYALSYCNSILDIDPTAYAGYACVADVYDSVGRPDASVKIYDLLVDRVPNRSQYYKDRAMYRQKSGDEEGYKQDIEKANSLSSVGEYNTSLIANTISPRKLTLQIIKS